MQMEEQCKDTQKKTLQAAYFIWDILFNLKHLFDCQRSGM